MRDTQSWLVFDEWPVRHYGSHMDTPTKDVIDVDRIRREASMPLLALSTATGIPRNTLRRKLANPSTFTIAEFTAVAAQLAIPESEWWVA